MASPFIAIPKLNLGAMHNAREDSDTSTGDSDSSDSCSSSREEDRTLVVLEEHQGKGKEEEEVSKDSEHEAALAASSSEGDEERCHLCKEEYSLVRTRMQCSRCSQGVCTACSQKYVLKSLGETDASPVCRACLPSLKKQMGRLVNRAVPLPGDFPPSMRRLIDSGKASCSSCSASFGVSRAPFLCHACSDPVCFSCSFEFGDERVALTANKVTCSRCWPGVRKKLQMGAKLASKDNDLRLYDAHRAEIDLGDRFLTQAAVGAPPTAVLKSPRMALGSSRSLVGKSCGHCRRSFSVWVAPSECARCTGVYCTSLSCTQVFFALKDTPCVCRSCWPGAKKQLRYICKTEDAASADAARAQLARGAEFFEKAQAGRCPSCSVDFDTSKHAQRTCSECARELCVTCLPLFVVASLGETKERPLCAGCVSSIKERLNLSKTPRVVSALKKKPVKRRLSMAVSAPLMTPSADANWDSLPPSFWLNVALFLRTQSLRQLGSVNSMLHHCLKGYRRLRPFTMDGCPPVVPSGVVPSASRSLSAVIDTRLVVLAFGAEEKTWRVYATVPAVQQVFESKPLDPERVPKFPLGSELVGDGLRWLAVTGRSVRSIGSKQVYHVYQVVEKRVTFARSIQIGGFKGVVETMYRGTLLVAYREGDEFVVEAWDAESGERRLHWKHGAASRSAKPMRLLVTGGMLRLLAKDRPTETPFTLFMLRVDTLELADKAPLQNVNYLSQVTLWGDSCFHYDEKAGAVKEHIRDRGGMRAGVTFAKLKLTRKQSVALVLADSQYIMVCISDNTVVVMSRVTGQKVRKFKSATPILELQVVRNLALIYTPTDPRSASSARVSPRGARGSSTLNTAQELQVSLYLIA